MLLTAAQLRRAARHADLKEWVIEVVVTAESVPIGQELCISYLPVAQLLLPASTRRERLDSWGFDCACKRCVADAS